MRLAVVDSFGMRENHGPVEGRQCGSCVHLEATAAPRPAATKPCLTTFRCARSLSHTSWSVSYPACGLYQRA